MSFLEPGLPFIGELLWPTRRHAELNRLICYTITSACLASTFPVGTSVALQRVRRAADLKPGVYLWQAVTPTYSRVILGRLTHQRRGAITLARETDEPSTVLPYCPLLWSRPGFALYRVSHYVSLPTSCEKESPLPVVPLQPQVDEWAERKLFEGEVEVSLRRAFAEPYTMLVSPKIARVVEQLIRADSRKKVAAIQAKLDALAGQDLVFQARQLINKGGTPC